MAEEKVKNEIDKSEEEKTEEREESPIEESKGLGLRYKKSKGTCRHCRRVQEKLFLKGEKCLTAKCPLTRKNYPPGMHGLSRRPQISEYARQLREKQKITAIYGIRENQLRNYFKKASQERGVTGERLFQILESRLDNVIYRLGFASSKKQARQMISSNKVRLNDKKVDIPSILLKKGDKVKIVGPEIKNKEKKEIPSWLKRKENEGEVLRLPKREEIDLSIDESLIIEFYSR